MGFLDLHHLMGNWLALDTFVLGRTLLRPHATKRAADTAPVALASTYRRRTSKGRPSGEKTAVGSVATDPCHHKDSSPADCRLLLLELCLGNLS